MAVTFAATQSPAGPTREVWGSYHVRPNVLLTATGDTSDNGDEVTAASLGLSQLGGLIIHSAAVDSQSNPENAFAVTQTQTTTNGVTVFKVQFNTAHGTPGATVPLLTITDGTTVTGYSFFVTAYGK